MPASPEQPVTPQTGRPRALDPRPGDQGGSRRASGSADPERPGEAGRRGPAATPPSRRPAPTTWASSARSPPPGGASLPQPRWGQGRPEPQLPFSSPPRGPSAAPLYFRRGTPTSCPRTPLAPVIVGLRGAGREFPPGPGAARARVRVVARSAPPPRHSPARSLASNPSPSSKPRPDPTPTLSPDPSPSLASPAESYCPPGPS
ncbi:proline-rich protein HaeIII subfamily 1-like [Cervus elaphus]|uniref:proline-rich protein HaeIII subfamily 1-like n=1 Tax=Cervus elaphus TaxID=9860 RepID=UPI001CC316A2|nr:proline-rich protein HaeIII subfamily 1-like [Cervus elaphus]